VLAWWLACSLRHVNLGACQLLHQQAAAHMCFWPASSVQNVKEEPILLLQLDLRGHALLPAWCALRKR